MARERKTVPNFSKDKYMRKESVKLFLFCLVCILSCMCRNRESVEQGTVKVEDPRNVVEETIRTNIEYGDKVFNSYGNTNDSALVEMLKDYSESHTFLLKKEIISRWELIKVFGKMIDDSGIKENNPELYEDFVLYVDSLYKDYYEFLGKTMNSAQLSLTDYQKFDTLILRN